MKKTYAILLFIFTSLNLFAGNKIKCYFNRPVDNSVSTGVNAQYLNNCSADTLVAFLSRAKYSLDICVYNFVSYSSSSTDNGVKIANAVNGAYSRGVKVRWIYEASNSNSGLPLLNTGIHTLGSPQGSNYTIMHNKFVIVDANSTNPNDAYVWTGCMNWDDEQYNSDYNNIVIVQDSALAHAYLGEYNMMWGDTGVVPNTSVSKFGQYKTNLGRHSFTVEGNQVELYFSPSDNTDSHIQSSISSANTDMYFGVYTFTMYADASLIVSKYNSGVYVAGIDDSYSNSYSPYTAFTSGLGSHFKVFTETSSTIYHNKFLIVDPSDACSDPLVLTGSHNWTSSANTHNDENTLIIHNDTFANLYYQYFKASFNTLGGVLTPINGCGHAMVPVNNDFLNNVSIYPNPSTGEYSIQFQLTDVAIANIEVYNVIGKKVETLLTNAELLYGNYTLQGRITIPGIYFVKFSIGNSVYFKKLIIS